MVRLICLILVECNNSDIDKQKLLNKEKINIVNFMNKYKDLDMDQKEFIIDLIPDVLVDNIEDTGERESMTKSELPGKSIIEKI